jgi:dihydroneopterin aldolase/D-erythro-7,8-dihydroneopterin triphosphate epimerase
MSESDTDRILIRELRFRCIVGINEDERRERQDVVVDLDLHVDLRPPGESDDMTDAVDYRAVKKAVLAMGESSECFLVERLATRVAETALACDERIRAIRVQLRKPAALRFARTVGVDITRTRDE